MNNGIANLMGMVALLAWSLNVGVTRHIAEAHHFGLPGLSFLAAGLLLIGLDLVRGKGLPRRGDADPKFWRWGGAAFVTYMLLYVYALSWSASRDVVLPLGLVNYFWPALILLLMPAFFACRVGWSILSIGLALCLAGVGFALLWDVPLAGMAKGIADDWPAFLMMGGAAFLWAFYTNAARKWAGRVNGTGWFMAAAGVVLLFLWFLEGGSLGFESGMVVPFLLHAVVVNAVAYSLWDAGVRRGDLRLLGLLANFLPIGSVVFGAWYLGGAFTTGLWLGGGLVAMGALLCRKGLDESPQPVDAA